MSGGIEAAGDAVTGAVVAYAIEPGQDTVGRDGHTHETACLNCGTPLTGSFCSHCGQAAHLHRSLIGLWHDIAHGVFHFEGRVWRTLPMLVAKPGELTRRYIHGERARFVSPLALFLFAVFLMFAVFEGVGGPIRLNFDRATMSDGTKVAVGEFNTELVKTRAKLAALQQRRASLAKGQPTVALDKQIEDTRDDVNGLTAASTMVNGVSPEGVSIPDDMTIRTGLGEFDNKIRATLKNPRLLLYKLQSSAYKFAWALVPLSLPLMWLMFAWRRQYKLYDHAIFVTYSLSFIVVLLVAMALLAALGAPTGWALFVIPLHFFVQLKGAYSLSAFSAAWRTFALLIFAPVVLTTFAVTLLLLGLLG